jgi:hypothetical protein
VDRLTGTAVDAWMRKLEASGRADEQGGLSARTVRYVFTILRAALADAVRQRRLARNPTDHSTPPSPAEARPPEMKAWTAAELARFLSWADDHDCDLAMGWRLLAATGLRRGRRWPSAGGTSIWTPAGSTSAARGEDRGVLIAYARVRFGTACRGRAPGQGDAWTTVLGSWYATVLPWRRPAALWYPG